MRIYQGKALGCILDVMKITGVTRAPDIALPHVCMNKIKNGVVYDWASLLADRMKFMMLQHRTFYLPHHTMGLFLEVALH